MNDATTAKVREAAERLQGLVGATFIDFENASPECVRDMWTLASAYLALDLPAFARRCLNEGMRLQTEYKLHGNHRLHLNNFVAAAVRLAAEAEGGNGNV
ncbi:MAG TPA: hypothetical protein VEA69_21115 [Tepidisphaeraceae bacterium]|nr:hypothetical protein [Tepidisphaeraceae bacterium]